MFTDNALARLTAASSRPTNAYFLAWANDEIVHETLRFVRRRPRLHTTGRHVRADQWPTLLYVDSLATELFVSKFNERQPTGVRELGLDAAVLLDEPSAPVFMPLCSRDASHWSLLVLCGERRRYAMHFDSMGNANCVLGHTVVNQLVQSSASQQLWPLGARVEYTPVESAAQQTHAWECGYCVGLFASSLIELVYVHGSSGLTPAFVYATFGAHPRMCSAENCTRLANTLLDWHEARNSAKRYAQTRLRHLLAISE